MTVSVASGSKKIARGFELPEELASKVWLLEDGEATPKSRRWEFQKGEIYQIGQSASPKALLVYLRDEGIHHVFKSYRVAWITTFTNSQLHGIEVMKLASDIKPCPHCGGKVLKLSITKDKEAGNGHFIGRILCQNKSCEATASWQIALPKASTTADTGVTAPEEKSVRLETAAKGILIATWNRRA